MLERAQQSYGKEQQIRNPEKMRDGSVKLPFTHGGIEFDFKLKKGKDGKVYISNLTPEHTGNRGYLKNKDAVYPLDVSSSKAFSQSLGKALDNYIGVWRKSMEEEKWKKAFKLLWFTNILLEEAKQQEEQEAIQQTKRELELLTDQDFSWNEKEKSLHFIYLLGTYYGATVSIKAETWGNIRLVMETHQERRLWSNSLTKTFSKAEIDKIPSFIEKVFKDWQTLKTFLNIPVEKNYRPNDALIQKCKDKASKAVTIFKLRNR